MPPGWVLTEDGAWRRETIHHMGRRCRNWDYCGIGIYMVTMTLNDRRSRALGRLYGPPGEIELTRLGKAVEAHVRRIAEFSPEIEVIAARVMPDHLHVVLRVRRQLKKPLGEHLRGFKIGCTKLARELGAIADVPSSSGIDARESVRGEGLFADGFVDTIIHDDTALEKEIGYLADNPRRLWEKLSHPELFRVLRDFSLPMLLAGRERIAHFAAIGNSHLLEQAHLLQVQVSRRDFAYARGLDGELLKNAPPSVRTPAFDDAAADLLAAAEHGAVLVSPCISHGEKEIARLAFEAGRNVITLQNKGFSPLYKPGGKLFDQCADGRLLMLAPAAWPYLPGKKPMTRMDACVLNRIAQLICGEGSVEINYHGMQPSGVEKLVAQAVMAPLQA